MSLSEPKPMQYFYVVHGIVPDLMACVAYRRVGKSKIQAQETRKVIKCPYCGGRLTDVGASAKVELYRHPAKGSVKCHGYVKCQCCKDEVGIILA